MTSVVLELQRDALDRKVPVADLFRRALVVARKLSLTDMQAWISNELSGYPGSTDIPEYRRVHGQVRALDPYGGWIPVVFKDPKMGESCSVRNCRQSVAELEHLNERGAGTLQMPFTQEVQRMIASGIDLETEVTLFLPHASLVRILDTVRTILLNWALKLEEEGVLGTGLAFTPEEQKAAVTNPQSINYFYGPVHGAQIQQSSPSAVQVRAVARLDGPGLRKVLAEVRTKLDELDLSAEDRREFEAEVRTVEVQLDSPKPKPKIVSECLSSIRVILENAGGSLLARTLLEALSRVS